MSDADVLSSPVVDSSRRGDRPLCVRALDDPEGWKLGSRFELAPGEELEQVLEVGN